jgi:pilus assembly protein CpaE
MWHFRFHRDESGQASVELIALLPALGAVVALAWQAIIAGETWWLASVAAREGARAQALGGDARRAATAALPQPFAPSTSTDDDTVIVRLGVPSLAGLRIGTVTAKAHMERQR